MKVMFSMYDDMNDCAAPKTLCDWVKNFRMKKIQMKRKLRTGGNLRVCAIMATALNSAENQLRLKQQERLNRCLQLQSKFHEKLKGSTITTMTLSPVSNRTIMLSSSGIGEYEEDQKQRIEICNLWKDELNGLDEFMRKMSSSGSSSSCGSCSSNQYQNSNNYNYDSCNNFNVENSTCTVSAFQYGDKNNEATTVLRHSIAISS